MKRRVEFLWTGKENSPKRGFAVPEQWLGKGALHDKQRTIISNLIAEAIARGRIKRKDPLATSSKFAEYVPYWA